MTRVLMTADAVGGVWQYATDLAAALRPLGVDVTLAVLGPPPGADQRLEATLAGCKLIETDLPLDWLCDNARPVLAAGRAIGALAREIGADLVHLNSPSLLAAGPMGVPVLAVDHGGIGTWWQAAHGARPDEAYQWLDALIRAGLIAADAVVAPSASYAAAVARHHRLPTVPLAVHNGRAPVPVASDEARGPGAAVFTAGRLWDPVKNTALLDRVAARLPVAFEAAGALRGPHGEEVACRHLLVRGPLPAPAIAARLAERPIFVSAARFEPFGLAVLEAAQAGCPLVLSGLGTFRELWTGAALIVPEQDEAAYAAAIERILGDDALRQHLGEAARIRAQRYTPQATATAVAAIYTGLLGDPHRVAA
jgi:glycosyltransferase involved in cell wall biosynthesis